MYLPGHFRIDDRAAALEIIRDHPFAQLVSQTDEGPAVTHVPLVLDPDFAASGAPDAPVALLGHLAHGNPQWQFWALEPSVLAVFCGPDAYVSPARYSVREAVPTWNYIAVHVRGQVEILDAAEDKDRAQKALIAGHDPAYIEQWKSLPEAYQSRMLGGIVAFRIHADSVSAKFKLSQNRPEVDRDAVRRHQAAGSPDERGLARWMERLGL